MIDRDKTAKPDDKYDDKPRDDKPRDDGKGDPGKVPPDPYTPFPFPLPSRHGSGKGDDPIWSPYIVINHTDPDIPGGVFYLSPDLWVISSLGVNLPVQGEENVIAARIHNQGLMDAVNVNVRFYWANPSMAITDQSVTPIGGDAAAATATGVYIPAAAGPGQDSAVTVQCPVTWLPDAITHQCLLVKAWSPGIDPNFQPWEPVLDPVHDRHSAQHNVNVKMLPAGQSFKLMIEAANISPFAQTVRILVRSLSFRQVVGRIKMLHIPLKEGPFQPHQAMPVEAFLTDKKQFKRHDPDSFAKLLTASGGRGAKQADAGEIGEVVIEISTRFEPWEHRELVLEAFLPTAARPGDAYGFDVSQYLGEIRTGGYSSLVIAEG